MNLKIWCQNFLPTKIIVYGGDPLALVFRLSWRCLSSEPWTPPTPRVFDLRRHGWCSRICLSKVKATLTLLVWGPVWEPPTYYTLSNISLTRHMWAIIQIPVSHLSLSIFQDMSKLSIYSIFKFISNPEIQMIESLLTRKLTVEMKWNSCLILSPGHKPDKREKLQHSYSLRTSSWRLPVSNDTTQPTTFKALTKLLTCLAASFMNWKLHRIILIAFTS